MGPSCPPTEAWLHSNVTGQNLDSTTLTMVESITPDFTQFSVSFVNYKHQRVVILDSESLVNPDTILKFQNIECNGLARSLYPCRISNELKPVTLVYDTKSLNQASQSNKKIQLRCFIPISIIFDLAWVTRSENSFKLRFGRAGTDRQGYLKPQLESTLSVHSTHHNLLNKAPYDRFKCGLWEFHSTAILPKSTGFYCVLETWSMEVRHTCMQLLEEFISS